jgi:hypothetical protein
MPPLDLLPTVEQSHAAWEFSAQEFPEAHRSSTSNESNLPSAQDCSKVSNQPGPAVLNRAEERKKLEQNPQRKLKCMRREQKETVKNTSLTALT